jgi:hypothetical protein
MSGADALKYSAAEQGVMTALGHGLPLRRGLLHARCTAADFAALHRSAALGQIRTSSSQRHKVPPHPLPCYSSTWLFLASDPTDRSSEESMGPIESSRFRACFSELTCSK